MSTQVVPVMHIADVEAAVTYYTTVLGFTEDFRWKDYAGVSWDSSARLHLNGFGSEPDRIGKGQAYFLVPNVDEVYAGMVDRGATFGHHIVDNPYGMRDFSVLDPDGNRYTFGTDIPETTATTV
jgi:catechol 2,3-dioxygenase-like lactoylglutathione lyase family enzyme